jgi:CheY-like chemotaxis protein
MARILVVDDEGMVRKVMRRALEADGHEVVEAENGKVGLERLAEYSADLVIVDVFMPVMDGFEFISRLQKDYPPLKVLAISGSTYQQGPKFLEIAGRMSGVRTLAKPVTPDALLAAVHEMLAVDDQEFPE